MVRIALAAPQRLLDGLTPGEMLVSAARWEREQPLLAGYWVADRATGATAHLDPMAWAASLASATARARIGTAVVVAPLRHPLVTAHQAASIDRLSGGRFTLGLGSGSDRLRRAAGWPVVGCSDHVDAYVQSVHELMSGHTARSSGPGWALDGEEISPLPVQQPFPIWLSGHSRAAMRRAARLASGWIASGLVDGGRCVEHLSTMRELVPAAAGHTFQTAKRVYVHLPAACPPELRDHADWSRMIFGSPSFADAFVVRGSPAACLEALVPLISAGLDEVILDPVTFHPAHIDALLGELVPLLATSGG